MEEKLNLTSEWDKTFAKSPKVDHQKVTFHKSLWYHVGGRSLYA